MTLPQALLLLALTLPLWPSATQAQPCESLDALQWLLGEWLAQDDRTATHETWRRVSPRTFEGHSDVTRKATMEPQSTETLRLVEMSGEVFFIPKVSHNALPIAFKAVDCTEEMVVFENPAHDFPKRLEYRRGGADSLIVVVSDGASEGFMLRFARKPGS